MMLAGCSGPAAWQATTGTVVPVVPPPMYETRRQAFDHLAPTYGPALDRFSDSGGIFDLSVGSESDAAPSYGYASMTIPGDELAVYDVSGVSFSGLSACQAAEVVFADSFGTSYECVRDGGSISMYLPQADAQAIYQAFSGAVTASGGSVQLDGSIVRVRGGDGEGGGYAGSPPSGLPSVTPAPGVQAFSTDNPQIMETMRGIAVLQSPAVSFIEAPAGVSASDLRAISNESPLKFQVLETEGRVFYTANADDMPLLDPIVRGLTRTAVPVSSVPPSPATLAALRHAFPSVGVEPDPDANVVWLSGSPMMIGDLMRGHGRFFVPPTDYRVDAAFLSWRDGAAASHGVTPGLDLGRTNGAGLARVISAGATGGFSVMLDRVTSSGQAALVSKPSIAVRAGQPGRFVSGQSVPIRTQIGDGDELRDLIEYRETGVVVHVTPRPLLNGLVRLDLDLQISGVSGASGVGANPIFDTQNVQTSIEITPGDIVVLSGLSLASREAADGSVLYGPNGSEQRRDETLQVVITLRQEAGGSGSRLAVLK
jgi:hypothetical protein